MAVHNVNERPDRRFWGQSNPKPGDGSRGNGVEGPVTDSGNNGPGFYQTRGTGLKTGRTSSRAQHRASSRDLTLAAHGLIDQGAADPNQGQLFDANSVVGPRRSDADVIKDRGINMPTHVSHDKGKGKTAELSFGGAPGYMPNLSTKQKVSALKSVEEGRMQSGTWRGPQWSERHGDYVGGGATAEVLQDRAAVRDKAPNQSWYTGVDDDGSHRSMSPGDAPAEIARRATRSGTTPGAMTRAAAVTSPQSAWDRQKPGSPDHSYPNLDHAEAVVQATQFARSYVDRDEAVDIGSQIETKHGGLPTMGAKAAGQHYDHGHDATKPFPIKNAKSQKAPNFQASLHLSDPEPAARRMAAQSYTVDRHDAKAAGVGGSKVVEDRVGVYDALAMTGTRTAHKNRELPPNEQAREWVGVRGHNAVEQSDNTLFESGTDYQGRVVPNQRVFGDQSRSQKRSARAEEFGLDF